MKKLIRLLILVAGLILLIGLLTTSAQAATVMMDGVEATLTTDRSVYGSNDKIRVTLNVENRSGLPVMDVNLTHLNPEGYVWESGNTGTLHAESLNNGESMILTAINLPSSIPAAVDGSSSAPAAGDNSSSIPVTGDRSSIGLWMSLLLIGMIGVAFAAVKYRHAKKVLLLILCFACAGMMNTLVASASAEIVRYTDWPEKYNKSRRMMALSAEEPATASTSTNNAIPVTFAVQESVIVDGKQIILAANISFRPSDIYDNLNDGNIDLGDLETLAGNRIISVLYGDDGDIVTIDGPFTNQRINSASDASELLNSARSLFGENFYASMNEVRGQSNNFGSTANTETFYAYTPQVNGLRVLGSQIMLVTDGNGVVSGLLSTYDDSTKYMDTWASLSAEDAKAAAKNELLTDPDVATFITALRSANPGMTEAEILAEAMKYMTVEVELVIYAGDDSLPVATVYAVRIVTKTSTSGSGGVDESLPVLPLIDMTYYVHANGVNAGALHSSVSNIEYWYVPSTLTCEDSAGNNRTINVWQQGSVYQLIDKVRSIETYESTFTGFWPFRFWKLPGIIVDSYTDSSGKLLMHKEGVSAHANMAIVRDYYMNVLGRNSYDGNNAKIITTVDYGGKPNNAFWTSREKQFAFGTGTKDFTRSLDVCGHEFTHAVTWSIVPGGGLIYSRESGALSESLSDIMGSLIEGKNGESKWLIGEDSGALRDMADPSKYGDPEHYDNRYTDSGDNYGVHTNNGILNFAAYKMMTDSRTNSISDSTWAELFYRTMYRLTSDANFLYSRGAVINTAKRLGFNHDQQQAIKDAYDAVGIKEPDSVRIVLTWGSTPTDLDSHLVGPGVNGDRFHVFYAQRSYDLNGGYDSMSSISAADLDYDDTTSFGPEVTTIHKQSTGAYYFYVHDYTNRSTVGSTALAQSGATVKVYRGSSATPLQSYRVDATKNGTFWNVFRLTFVGNVPTLTKIDTYGDSTSYQ